ncbi:GAF domain-containing protein [Variovorax sp. HJSM1_2]|uniref:GAF domain-containing protein n=1 Tax=Variovorax sp. HJSM1_2 TaxID=3366263 RepID=UPI003BBB1CAC
MKLTMHAFGLFAGCLALLLSSMGSAQGRTLQDIRRDGELRICVAGSSAPFYQVNGEEFARHLGVRGKTTLLPSWDHQFHNAQGVTLMDARYEAALLASGQCDLYPNDLHMTAWRLNKMALVPYFTTRNVVVARPEMRDTLRTPQDLAGHVAAVQAGTAYESLLRELNAKTLVQRPITIQTAPTAQSMRRVAEHQADFTVIAAESAFKWVRDDLQNLDLLFALGEGTEVGWGVATDAEDLQTALADYLADSRRVGSRLDLSWRKNYDISLTEYQLFSATFDTRAQLLQLWSRWGLPAGLAFVGVMGVMLYWMRRLRREVARHKLAAEALSKSQEAMSLEVGRRKAVSELLLALQQTVTLEDFSQTVLQQISRHLPLGQAIFACVDAPDGVKAQAHYAGSGTDPIASLRELPSTMRLIDRCVATREPVLTVQPGADYLRIRSGLGHGAPAAILVMPIRHAEHVLGVIELAVHQPFTPSQRQLLVEFEPIVAVSLRRFLSEPDSEILQAGNTEAGHATTHERAQA